RVGRSQGSPFSAVRYTMFGIDGATAIDPSTKLVGRLFPAVFNRSQLPMSPLLKLLNTPSPLSVAYKTVGAIGSIAKSFRPAAPGAVEVRTLVQAPPLRLL